MKSTLLRLLFVLITYLEVISAVRYKDPFEEFLRRERLLEEEYRRQQEELRLRHLQQQEQLIREIEQNQQIDLNPTAVTESSDWTESDTVTIDATTTFDESAVELTTLLADEGVTTLSPRRQQMQSTCCTLGARAGRSGFLCNPENYRPQLLMRHELSRGNFKISRVDQYHYVETRQFSKCISGAVPRLSEEFQRCCKQAYVESLDEEVLGGGIDDDSDLPTMLELPLQMDILSKQRKQPRTHEKPHMKV